MQGIAFFDLEVSLTSKKIGSIGAVYEGQTWHSASVHDFERFTQEAPVLCGHNIFAHDLPSLEKTGISPAFFQKEFIDTLYLSPLLFPNRPYHRLVKDYRLMSDYLNNPVADAQLAQGLLADCQEAWYGLPLDLQYLFCQLLGDKREFRGFIRLVAGRRGETRLCPEEVREGILVTCHSRICENADLLALIQERPVQLAYALSLIHAPDAGSIVPPWLLFRFPDLTQVLHQLRAAACGKPGCRYCSGHLSPVAGLRRFFGYEGFRKFSEAEKEPLQQEVVEAALRDESILAIFPTGGGKSLTFQLPALMRGEANRGLTVVISPLQALMKDQVDVLRVRFDVIDAVAISGLLSPLERAEAIERVREGGVSLLYISPESLRSKTILSLLKGRHIERFVIDEAHCFSAWGQDFRVDYLYIGRFIRELGEVKQLKAPIPVSCFTATARPEVIHDIQHYFRQQAGLGLTLYQTTATRKNLTYHAARADGKGAKLQQLKDVLRQVSEPCIVYVSRTKTAVQVAEELQKVGYKAAAFHGRMDPEVKVCTQDAFMAGETDIIVATSAFGMGVDKENVKMVVHYDISDSLENYFQEAGRAGRKADLQAQCHLLFDENDLNALFARLNQTKLTRKEIGQIWKAVKELKREVFSKSALELAKQAGWDTDMRDLETQLKAAIAALEDGGFLKREQNSPRIFAQSILVRSVEAANKIIRAHPDRFPAEQEQQAVRVFQYLISRHDGEGTLTDYLSDDLGIPLAQVQHILLHFKELGLLGDTRDLTALVFPDGSERSSEKCCLRHASLETALLHALLPAEESSPTIQAHLRDLNERLHSSGCAHSSVEAIRNLLHFWEQRQFISKERLEAQTLLYRICFRQPRAQLLEKIHPRLALARAVVRWLCGQNAELIAQQQKREEAALAFSMVEMKRQVESGPLGGVQGQLVDYEAVLLYLHAIGAIKLEGGLFVLYNPMTIERLEKSNRRVYGKEDYAKLERHYEKKVEQIHIMGEYARKQLSNHLDALRFVDDYFQLPYEAFLHRHFPGQRGKLRQPITEKKFQEVFGALSGEQLEVIKDHRSRNILVGAGPGSGKTRVLVHKVAALLLMEDIKTEQFLMLTFSRPAAHAFKERLQQLIGNLAYYLDIFTFHGLAFQLLGRVGDLDKSENVVRQATQALQQEAVPADRIKGKSVIVVDEYQDLSQQEYDFLQTIFCLADEVRVMVVGDDDQNIYEFRGSSVDFMRQFERERQATKYLLSKNYRACANLVAFSNQFLSLFRSERLKAGFPLLAHNQSPGTVRLVRYSTHASLIRPLVEDLVRHRKPGTTAVLTPTNEEALLVQHLLLQQHVPARLISAQRGFSLGQLLELKCFSWYVHEGVRNDQGFIPAKEWEEGIARLKQEFSGSSNLPLVLEVIGAFERATGEHRFWSDWQAYLHEARAEDYAFPDEEQVLVSTMHKAKGKEFDQVFLLLKHYPLLDEARKRVVYVALTRARQALHLHTDQTYFDDFAVPLLEKITDPAVYEAPREIQLELGMSEVWLSHFRRPTVQHRVKALQAGAALDVPADPLSGLHLGQGLPLVKFSESFKGRLKKWAHQGYTCHRAEIAAIVVWHCREKDRDFRVVLPKVWMVGAGK